MHSETGMKKIVVLSDLHLVPKGELSYGIDTFSRAELAITRINANHADAVAVVFAGDLADHSAPASYERLAGLRSRLIPPTFATLGNHDDRDAYLAQFPTERNPASHRVDHVIDLPTHRFVVLDSHVPGSAEGALTDQQLAWLDWQFQDSGDRARALILHHNPADLALRTDAIRLRDPAALIRVLTKYRRVDLMLSGHVHMPTAGCFFGIPFATVGGNHFAVAPTLANCPHPEDFDRIFREGPAQFAVLLCDEAGIRVHFETYDDRHRALPIDLFRRILLP